MLNTKKVFLGTIAAMMAPMMAVAGPIVVDLEDVSTNGILQGDTVTSQGFDLTHSGSFALVLGNTGQGATDFSGNGTNRWISYNRSTLTVEQSGGGSFDIFSFEGGESWISQPHHWATQIQVVGTLAAGGIVTQIFDLDLFKDPLAGMQLFNFNTSFRGLSRLDFTGIGGNPEFSIDNLSVGVTSVPEPGTLALLGLGLAGMGLSQRKRKV